LLREWGLTDTERGITIPYLDTDGNRVATRYRLALDGENRFTWERGNRPCLYGLWRLREWSDTETLYLCEGETDTLTFWSAGLPALGIPGASVWRAEWWLHLTRFQRVRVIPDADDAGRQLVQKLTETCPPDLLERVEVLELPEGCKDANELWLQGDADPERFREALLVQSAKPLRDCTFALLHYSDPDDMPLLVPLRELLQNTPSEPTEYLPLLGIDGLIARGTLTLLGAHPKAGKTTLLIHACREWLQQGLKVVYLTEDPQPVWRERVKRFPELADLIVNAIPRANPYKWTQAIEALQPDLVIVDTIRRFLPANDENDSASVSSALAPFVDLSQKLPRTAIVLVHHTKKSLSQEGEITDIAGSHAFTAEVDTILLLAPVREHNRQRVLTPLAGRLWTLAPDPLVLELSEDGSTYTVLGIASEVLPEARAQSTKQKILQAVEALGQATPEEVAEYLRGQGEALHKRTVYHYLAELHAEGRLEREGSRGRGGGYVFYCNSAKVQPLNPLHYCTIAQSAADPFEKVRNCETAPERLVSSLFPEGDLRENKLTDADTPPTPPESSDSALTTQTAQAINALRTCALPSDAESPDNPVREDSALTTAYTRARALYRPAGDIEAIIERLQRNPEYPLSEDEAERMRAVYALAESLGYPALELPDWNLAIDATRVDWVNALPVLAGTDALDDAMQALLAQVSRSAGEPAEATQRKTLRNGSEGVSPASALQLTLTEVQ